jgi:hypothetical protein
LTNPVENSLAIGMKSTKPTLFISNPSAKGILQQQNYCFIAPGNNSSSLLAG